MSQVALTLPGLAVPTWQVRCKNDPAACALADRHSSRRRPGSGQVGPPGRKLVLVTPCERAMWLTHWPYADLALDGLDCWRCSIFRNEAPAELRSSHLIRAAMDLTARLWAARPTSTPGWVTWVDPAKVASPNPGYSEQLGTDGAFIPLTSLRDSLRSACASPHQAGPRG